MEFQPLPNIGLRTSPNVECEMIKEALGIEIPVPPIKLVMTEGNIRVINTSQDPYLISAMKRVRGSGQWFGTYRFYPYNFFALRSQEEAGNPHEAAIHENTHALHRQLRVLRGLPVRPEESCEIQLPTQKHTVITPDQNARLTDYLFREGLADWVATETLLASRNLASEQRAMTHLKNVIERLSASRAKKMNINQNPNFLYNFGHRFVFLVMAFLTGECKMTTAEALEKIIFNSPTTVSQINESLPRSYLKTLDLPTQMKDRYEIEDKVESYRMNKGSVD